MARPASSKKASAKKKPTTKKPAKPKVKKRAAAPRKAKRTAPAKVGKAAKGKSASPVEGRVEVRNVNVPGYRNTVDATKYGSMHSALMAALPSSPPGFTQNEMLEAVLPKLSQQHFPGGDKAMWWIKTVQLDQEARGGMKRSDTKPLRWWRTAKKL